ncbi:MAG: pyridoxine 5'-phosphate synthase, partial [Rickettsiales bacterium]
GHGLNFKNVSNISQIENISELNVGHFIIAQSLFNGLKETISKFREIINESRF